MKKYEMSTNEPGQEPVVKIEGPQAFQFGKSLEVGPVSITIFRIAVK